MGRKEKEPTRAAVIMDLFVRLKTDCFRAGELTGEYVHREQGYISLPDTRVLCIYAEPKLILRIKQKRPASRSGKTIWCKPRAEVYDEAFSDLLDAYIVTLTEAVAGQDQNPFRERDKRDARKLFEETRF